MSYIILLLAFAGGFFSAEAEETISWERKTAVLGMLDRMQAEQKQLVKEANAEVESIAELRNMVVDSEIPREKKEAIFEILADSENSDLPVEPVEYVSEEQLSFQMRNCSYKESFVKKLFPGWNQRHWCEDNIELAVSAGYSYNDIKSLVSAMRIHSPQIERTRNRPLSH